MSATSLARYVKLAARDARFDECRVAPAEPIGRSEYVYRWLNDGRDGTMAYLARNIDVRLDPRKLLDGARSVIVCALVYRQDRPYREDSVSRPSSAALDHRGRLAMYAWGEDYHTVVKDKLYAMVDRLRAELVEPFTAKVCVDTAPLLEREVAARAGIGWIGKNTMVLSRELGSFFVLGALVTSLEIERDEPIADHCGTCTACLDACPTAAFPTPYEMDASRCVSYLTIEHRGEIPSELRAGVGDWLFGCDVCQDVCPFNRKTPSAREPRLGARAYAAGVDPKRVMDWTLAEYQTVFRKTAVRRATLDMLKRNAQIVVANLATATDELKAGADPSMRGFATTDANETDAGKQE